MNAKLKLARLKKWRSDRVLRWVKPGTNNYQVVVYRRVNPRYKMKGGAFDDINEFHLVEVHYARWRWLAIIYQALLGRATWSDGFKQQLVTIYPPNYRLPLIRPGGLLTPVTSPYDFDGYPSAKGFDDVNDDPDYFHTVDMEGAENPYADKVPPKFVDDVNDASGNPVQADGKPTVLDDNI